MRRNQQLAILPPWTEARSLGYDIEIVTDFLNVCGFVNANASGDWLAFRGMSLKTGGYLMLTFAEAEDAVLLKLRF